MTQARNLEAIEDVLVEVARHWEPTDSQKAAAQRSHNSLRALLDSERSYMGARILNHYLSGSYARQTAVAPIDDVDIVFEIDPREWPCGFWSELPEPSKVLDSFARAIRKHRPNSSVIMQRRSVCLSMEKLSIDVVPAIATEKNGYIKIPDVDKDDWILTGPRVHAQVATDVNQARDGFLKPAVKILKGWNSELPKSTRLKSFAIETIAVRVFRETPVGSLYDAVFLFFDFLFWQFNEEPSFEWSGNLGVDLWWSPLDYYELKDVADTGSNLLASLTGTQRTAFLKAARRCREQLQSATSARTFAACEAYVLGALRVA